MQLNIQVLKIILTHVCLTASESTVNKAKCFSEWGWVPAFSIRVSKCGVTGSVVSRLVITSKVSVCA